MTAPLAALRLIRPARDDLDDREYRLIAQARDEGITWREIADALDLDTPQAAAQRYERMQRRTVR